jgi:uncharacterized protein YybS (DUF2232 family)
MASPLADPRLAPAAAAAASLGLYLAPWAVPFLGTLASLGAPLPLVALYRRHGMRPGRVGLAYGLGGAAVAFVLLGGGGALFYLFYAALAACLGEAPFWGLRDDQALGAATVAGVVTVLAVGLLAGGLAGDVAQTWQDYWRAETRAALEIYRDSGATPEQMEAIRRTLDVAGTVLRRMGAGILVAGALLIAWVNLMVVRAVRPGGAEAQPLTEWRAPEWLVWVLIASGALMALTSGFWFWAGANAVLVLTVVYFFQGCAVLAFWLGKKNAPRPLRGLIYVLVAVEVFLAVIVALAGLFDMWFNFRRLGREPQA